MKRSAVMDIGSMPAVKRPKGHSGRDDTWSNSSLPATDYAVEKTLGYEPIISVILSFADWRDKTGPLPLVNRAFHAAVNSAASWHSVRLRQGDFRSSAHAVAFLDHLTARFGHGMRVIAGFHRLAFRDFAGFLDRCSGLTMLHWDLQSADDFEAVARTLPRLRRLEVHDYFYEPDWTVYSHNTESPPLLGRNLTELYLPVGPCIENVGELCPRLECFQGTVNGACLRSLSVYCDRLASLSIVSFVGLPDDFVDGVHSIARTRGPQLQSLCLAAQFTATTDTYGCAFKLLAEHCTQLKRFKLKAVCCVTMRFEYLLPLIASSGRSLEEVSVALPKVTSADDLIRCAQSLAGHKLKHFELRLLRLPDGLEPATVLQIANSCTGLRTFVLDGLVRFPCSFDNTALHDLIETLPQLECLQLPGGYLTDEGIALRNKRNVKSLY